MHVAHAGYFLLVHLSTTLRLPLYKEYAREQSMRAIKNVRIYDYENYIDNGYLIYDEKIRETGKMEDFCFKGEVLNAHGKFLIPGLINSHTHIYSTLVRGLSLDFAPENFKDILEQIWWKLDAKLNLEAIEASAFIYGIESLKCGVTTLIDHHASGLDILGSLNMLRKVITEVLHMRGLFCFETSDRFKVSHCLEENLQAGDYFGLHASLTLSDETLKKVAEKITKPIHIHLAESIDDEKDSFEKYNMSVAERLEKFKLLKKDSIIAHAIHINEKEASLLAENNCLIALNPSSNLNNTVGIFNYELYKKYNIPLLIGTDGLGANIASEWLNFYYLAKHSLNDPAGITFDEVRKYLAESYFYISRQLGKKIGKLEKDYEADFLLLDYYNPTEINEQNVFSHLFYGCFTNFRPSDVWVKGRQLIRKYETIFDEKDIYAEAAEIAKKLWERINS